MAGYIGTRIPVISPGAERKRVFNVTGSQSVFTGVLYTPGFVHVFKNGERLVEGTDYTGSNGTSITLTTPATGGDVVVVISNATFDIADVVPSTGGTFQGPVDFADSASFLDIDIADKIAHSGDTDTAIRFPEANTFSVETAGSERMRVDSDGNVGIGTTSPTEALDVSGTVKATAFEGDGSQLTGINAGSWEILQRVTANNDAALDFAVFDHAVYEHYHLIYSDVVTPGVNFNLRYSTDGGSTFHTSGYAFGKQYRVSNSFTHTDAASQAQITLCGTMGGGFGSQNTANVAGMQGELFFFNPGDPTSPAVCRAVTAHQSASYGLNMLNQDGWRAADEAVDAFRLFPTSGNIVRGNFTLLGLKR